ncbi:MAG: Ig-like domain repeat protein [Acidobacteriota bacterium]|nr:Ig-like domain repeat protein [Acidobacteriota bacterium]
MLQFTTASGTLASNLFGLGQGAALTLDPGSVVSTTTKLSAPAGIAVDSLGDVFVTDSTVNSITEFIAGSNGVGTTVATGSIKLSGPKGIAVDSAGDLFIADTGNNRVVEVPAVAGVLTGSAAVALSPVLKTPQAVAVDPSGSLYIADTGNNRLLLIPSINGALSFSSVQSLGASLAGPAALAFDQNGNLFVAETGNNDVLEFATPIGGPAQVIVASGFTTPTGLATDASNSLFVVDSGTGSIVRYPNPNGVFGSRTLVPSTVLSPIGVAADASGDLFVTDTSNKVVAEINRLSATLQFGGVNVGSTGTQTGFLNSSGNLPVVFPATDYTVKANAAPGFAVTQDTCSGTTLAPGSACSLTSTYTPTAVQLNAEEDLAFAGNAANGSPVFRLIGTAARLASSSLSLVLTTPAGATSVNAGQAVSFTATIGTAGNAAVPGGSVNFYVNGVEVVTVPVKNSSAVLTLKNGLPGGSAVVISAIYTGDTVNYASSSAQLTENVVALADTLSLSIQAPYTNPLSARDNAANAAGPSITMVATVTPSSTLAPTGIVTFYAGTKTLGIASVLPGSFTATLVTTQLRAGTTNAVENGSFLTTYNVSAVYSGDQIYAGATSSVAPLTIVGANGSNNTTGATFTITPANPTITVNSTSAPGQVDGSVTLTITSYGGWAGVLNFTCAGLPKYTTCSPFPGAPVVGASTPSSPVPLTTVNFIISTNVVPPISTGAASVPWWTGGLAGLLLLTLRRRIARSSSLRTGHILSCLGLLMLLGASVFGVTACSSAVNQYVTPAGQTAVTVTVRAAQAVSGSTTGQVQTQQDSNIPPVNITLVVK